MKTIFYSIANVKDTAHTIMGDSSSIAQNTLMLPNPKTDYTMEIMHQIPAILALSIPIVAIIAFLIIAIVKVKHNHQERLKMIEKGLNPNEHLSHKDLHLKHRRRNPFFILIGVGVGLLIGTLLETLAHMDTAFAFAAPILICIGVSLYLKQQYERKQNSNE